jgi:dTDP-4-dehydrorhamnose reductase
MRIEVVGSAGQLGRELLRVLAGGHHIGVGHDIDHVDIREPASVRSLLGEVGPDVVINCAAWTRVDAAESEPEAARRINAHGPRVLAEECRRRGIRLCHVSTDYVFDGTSIEPLDESAVPRPQSAYGRTKLEGEEAVRSVLSQHQIVRTAWLYGQRGPNFVLTMLRLARERGELRVVADQHGTPTWTGHLAPAIVRLVELGTTGTFHLTNAGSTTWFGFAQAIVEDAALDVPVIPLNTADYPTPAPRPAYSVLDNRAWRELGERPLPAWRAGLRSYLAEMGQAAMGSASGR